MAPNFRFDPLTDEDVEAIKKAVEAQTFLYAIAECLRDEGLAAMAKGHASQLAIDRVCIYHGKKTFIGLVKDGNFCIWEDKQAGLIATIPLADPEVFSKVKDVINQQDLGYDPIPQQ